MLHVTSNVFTQVRLPLSAGQFSDSCIIDNYKIKVEDLKGFHIITIIGRCKQIFSSATWVSMQVIFRKNHLHIERHIRQHRRNYHCHQTIRFVIFLL